MVPQPFTALLHTTIRTTRGTAGWDSWNTSINCGTASIRGVQSAVAAGQSFAALAFYIGCNRRPAADSSASLAGRSSLGSSARRRLSFYLNSSLIGGSALVAPFVMYHGLRFSRRPCTRREEECLSRFVALTSSGTWAGRLFSHVVLFPPDEFLTASSSPR